MFPCLGFPFYKAGIATVLRRINLHFQSARNTTEWVRVAIIIIRQRNSPVNKGGDSELADGETPKYECLLIGSTEKETGSGCLRSRAGGARSQSEGLENFSREF